MKKIITSALVASSLALAGGDIAPAEPVVDTPVEASNPWKNEITIYGWLPSISATTPLPNSSGDGMDAEDIIDDLKMVFMGTYSGRNDTWSVFGDFIYFDMGDSKNHTFSNGDTAYVSYDLKTTLIQVGMGYSLINNSDGILDVTAGIRYLDLELELNTDLFTSRSVSGSKDYTDFFIGVRGAKNITQKWYIPYEADIGTGDSDLSWQLFAGVGYRYDWGDIKLGYRYLKYEMDDDSFVEDLTVNGAVLGVSIKF